MERITVEYYGTPTPLRQMSQVSVQEGTTLVITPYDKTIIKEIEKLGETKNQKYISKGMKPQPIRAMIIGIPIIAPPKNSPVNAAISYPPTLLRASNA